MAHALYDQRRKLQQAVVLLLTVALLVLAGRRAFVLGIAFYFLGVFKRAAGPLARRPG